jgi:hypothetical protein
MGSLAGGEQSAMQPPSRLQLAKSPPPPSGFGEEPSLAASCAPPSWDPPEDEPDDEPEPEEEPEDDPELDPDVVPELEPEIDPELELDMPASPSPRDGLLPESLHAPSATSAASIGDEAESHRTMTGASWSCYGP